MLLEGRDGQYIVFILDIDLEVWNIQKKVICITSKSLKEEKEAYKINQISKYMKRKKKRKYLGSPNIESIIKEKIKYIQNKCEWVTLYKNVNMK